MKKIIVSVSLICIFVLLIVLSLSIFVGYSYSRHVKNKNIEKITCVWIDGSGVINEDNYDELVEVLKPMRYKIWFGQIKAALIDYIKIDYANGKTLILSKYHYKNGVNNIVYFWDSTFDINKIKSLVDPTTITILG